MARAKSPAIPYATRVPKPKILDLIRLLARRHRPHYRTLSTSLKRLPGVHPELYYYGTAWGWALRYRRGDATLCTMHFLPSRFEATITVTRALEDWALGPNHLSPATKRDLVRQRRYAHSRWMKLSLNSPLRARDLYRMVRYKAFGL